MRIFLTFMLFSCFSLAAAEVFTDGKREASKTEVSNNQATITTTEGVIVVKLFPDVAPKAVENFLTHAKDHYYDNTVFHRVIPGFMIQGGDPLGNGTGGQSIWGQSFEDEFKAGLGFTKPGMLAMANRGPKTNGSQFFITTGNAPWLNQKHTIFGEVVKGYDVVQKIEKLPTGSQNRPINPPKILSITQP